MKQYKDPLERSIHGFALATALAVALSVPIGTWFIGSNDLAEALDFKARVKAATLSLSIASNPDTWMFAENRLQGLIAREPVPLEDELVLVFDQDHALITQAGNPPPTPVLQRAYPLHDSGREVGQIVVAGSMQAHIRQTLLAGLLGALLGVLVYAIMKMLPLRALRKANAELYAYQSHLEEMVKERTLALSIAKEAADDASRAKSIFLANMSHELRTPMNAIMGMIDLALRRGIDSKQIDQLGKAKLAARQLLAIINDILDISKIEAERLTLEQAEFHLDAVMKNLDNLAGQEAAAKHLQLTIDLPVELSRLALFGDALRLGQILLNLVSNAIKFTERGSVTVRVRANADDGDAMLLRFEVTDTGIGIPPEARQRLFSAFEQADNSTTRKYGGTGLGLAICKRLVNLMGGEIGVDSTPGQGSTFWFTAWLRKHAGAVPPAPTVH
jgi:signal transduction histidine kinase